jgi:hypothetical protein
VQEGLSVPSQHTNLLRSSSHPQTPLWLEQHLLLSKKDSLRSNSLLGDFLEIEDDLDLSAASILFSKLSTFLLLSLQKAVVNCERKMVNDKNIIKYPFCVIFFISLSF